MIYDYDANMNYSYQGDAVVNDPCGKYKTKMEIVDGNYFPTVTKHVKIQKKLRKSNGNV